jgi:hypothetical protein
MVLPVVAIMGDVLGALASLARWRLTPGPTLTASPA